VKPTRHSLVRIGIEAAALVAIHAALLQVLARVNLMEHLLAPGAGSFGALAATAIFLLLRSFLLVAAPGWVSVRLWLWATRKRTD
jgi:hypothetical protein